MTPQLSRSIEAHAEGNHDWLWTWSGACFGYRVEVSLFTYDGIEAGRFFGADIYGADGRYLGEVSTAGDGPRLITNVYKKSLTRVPFAPDLDHPQVRPEARAAEPLFTGHEDFPPPDIAKQRRPTQSELRRQIAN